MNQETTPSSWSDTGAANVTFRPLIVDGYKTGVLDISLKDRRVLSIPSQLGCRIGCSFCVSKDTPLIRNLSASEMLRMVQACFDAEPADGRPVELSFTGEGEPLLNWRQTTACAEKAARRHAGAIIAIRYCFSGIGATQLLSKARHTSLPVRLQFSLHAARQRVRDKLVPRSESLDGILDALHAHKTQFSAIELNVVLLDGINDSEEDLQALIEWGDPRWPVLLNPRLADGQVVVARETGRFAETLRAARREVKVYSRIGAIISRERIYPLMSAKTVAGPTIVDQRKVA